MNCCGKKRQALASAFSTANRTVNEGDGKAAPEPAVSDHTPTTAVFRYSGASALEISGIFGRRLYKFSAAVPELVVMAEDVAIMRGYSELIELKRQR